MFQKEALLKPTKQFGTSAKILNINYQSGVDTLEHDQESSIL